MFIRFASPLLAAFLVAGPISLGGISTAERTRRDRPKLIPLRQDAIDLKAIPFQIVYETYRQTNGRKNWELFAINADGTGATNLTNTPGVDEMYPRVSPDGTKIVFVVDEGTGQNRTRHLYYMNVDGTERVHVQAHARQPCWCFDSKSIAYLKGEYTRYSTREYATAGLMFYNLESGWHRPHRNKELHHLYGITWSPYGKWFLGVVHGGMGYSDTILAFDAFGTRVFDLAKWGVKGCRPDLNADGTRLVWGETDWNLRIGDIDLTQPEPVVSNIRDIVRCGRKFKVYHVDISPDDKHIVFTYGPFGGGQQVGGMARGWNLCIGDLTGRWVQITTDGLHNKEPDWIPIPKARP
jgi:Tol biopolymer transport system component